MNYGINNNKYANTVIDTTRAFTGHEQIAEFSGLIHMNARLYDSDIGRFLSADTLIQYPEHSQGYNRYSYIENNPLMAPDPTGHGFFSFLGSIFKFIVSNIRTIASIVVAAVVVATLGSWATAAFGAFGAFGGAVVTGAIAGFASGLVATGSITGALKGAFWGAIGAAAAFGVAELTANAFNISSLKAHAATLWKAGMQKIAVYKSMLHGLTRGIISKLQGGRFLSGFMSGVSSMFDVGAQGHGGFVGRTAIMAIVGGTFSMLGGGKFASGALAGAFVHMFNAEKGFMDGVASVARGLKRFGDYLARVSGFRDWQVDSVVMGDYHQERAIAQTKATYKMVKYIATDAKARSLFIDYAQKYAGDNKLYLTGRVVTGFGLSAFSKVPLAIPTAATTGDILYTSGQIDNFARGVMLGE